MFNHDFELEKRYHPENFDIAEGEDVTKITVFNKNGKKVLEYGKIGKGKFKFGIKKYKI